MAPMSRYVGASGAGNAGGCTAGVADRAVPSVARHDCWLLIGDPNGDCARARPLQPTPHGREGVSRVPAAGKGRSPRTPPRYW